MIYILIILGKFIKPLKMTLDTKSQVLYGKIHSEIMYEEWMLKEITAWMYQEKIRINPFLLLYNSVSRLSSKTIVIPIWSSSEQSKQTKLHFLISNFEKSGPTSWFCHWRARDQHSNESRKRKEPDPIRNVKRVQKKKNCYYYYYCILDCNQEYFVAICRYMLSTKKGGDATSPRDISGIRLEFRIPHAILPLLSQATHTTTHSSNSFIY